MLTADAVRNNLQQVEGGYDPEEEDGIMWRIVVPLAELRHLFFRHEQY